MYTMERLASILSVIMLIIAVIIIFQVCLGMILGESLHWDAVSASLEFLSFGVALRLLYKLSVK